jgi:hypothetical protein
VRERRSHRPQDTTAPATPRRVQRG